MTTGEWRCLHVGIHPILKLKLFSPILGTHIWATCVYKWVKKIKALDSSDLFLYIYFALKWVTPLVSNRLAGESQCLSLMWLLKEKWEIPLQENGDWSRHRYLPVRSTTRHPHVSSGTYNAFGTLIFKFLDFTALQKTAQDNPLKGLRISIYILIRQKTIARSLNATLSYRCYISNRKINKKI